MGLHGDWYVSMYKKKTILKKNYTRESFNMLPLSDFSKTVFGEEAKDFDEILKHPDINDDFWKTRYGGGEAHNAIKHSDIPILLVTGFYDIYTGGVFDMWNSLDAQTKSKSALAVHPFEHGGSGNNQPILFENGVLRNEYKDYALRWINSIRGKDTSPFRKGMVTYYKLFSNEWCTDTFKNSDNTKIIPFGQGEVTYCYNPYNPATFKGGLSANFGGNAWQDPPNSRYDIISLYTPEFLEDTFIKGKMKAKLKVKSTCEDTCFIYE
jgi:predicted acyl esterase